MIRRICLRVANGEEAYEYKIYPVGGNIEINISACRYYALEHNILLLEVRDKKSYKLNKIEQVVRYR